MFSKIKSAFYTLLVVLAIVGVAGIGWFIYTTFVQEEGYYVNTSGTAVVTEIQKLSRLETAAYTIEKVIDAGTQGNAFQELLFGDKILLIANGQVIAGIDFSQVTEDSIQINGSTIIFNSPPPSIFFTRLDNESTRVYDRSTGLLSRGETDLESTVRAQAEVVIRQAACDAGILATAEENARKQLNSLFTALGFTAVTVNIPEGSC